MSGDATYLGSPPLSPVYDGSNAIVRKPRSARFCAYRPEACSFTAPNGPDTATAGMRPSALFGVYISAASVMPKRLLNLTFLCSTLSLFGKVLSQLSIFSIAL